MNVKNVMSYPNQSDSDVCYDKVEVHHQSCEFLFRSRGNETFSCSTQLAMKLIWHLRLCKCLSCDV